MSLRERDVLSTRDVSSLKGMISEQSLRGKGGTGTCFLCCCQGQNPPSTTYSLVHSRVGTERRSVGLFVRLWVSKSLEGLLRLVLWREKGLHGCFVRSVGVRQSLESGPEEIHGATVVREGERSTPSSCCLCGLLEGRGEGALSSVVLRPHSAALIFCRWDLRCQLSICFHSCFLFILVSCFCLQTMQP